MIRKKFLSMCIIAILHEGRRDPFERKIDDLMYETFIRKA